MDLVKVAKVQINVNAKVQVVLTERGRDILVDYHEKACDIGYTVPELGETFECELWMLFRIFGPSLHQACKTPFSGNLLTFEAKP